MNPREIPAILTFLAISAMAPTQIFDPDNEAASKH